MFTEQFGPMVLDRARIRAEVDGFECIAWTEHDPDRGAPDKECDGFWPSLDPQDDGYIGAVSTEEWGAAWDKASRVMRAWENNEWDWCGVVVEVRRAGVLLTERYDHALWGIERNWPDSDNSYLTDVANELLPAALDAARAKLAGLCAGCASSAAVPDVWDRIRHTAASRKEG